MRDLFASRSASPMLIGAVGAPYDDVDSLFELKLDGERCLAYLDQTEAVLVNRRGFNTLSRLPELAGVHKQVSTRCILDGEVITGLGGKQDFDQIQARLAHQSLAKIALGAKRHPASFVVFDILYHGGRDVTATPLEARKALLEKTVADSAHMAVARTVETEGKAFYRLVLQQGLEGVVGKKKHSLYYPGKRTRDWVKVKNTQEDDYVIGGYVPAAHVAALVLGQYDTAGRLVYRGRATLGLATEDFAAVRRAPRAAAAPFASLPPEQARALAKAVWLKPELVCTVAFTRRFEGGAMRQPHYVRLRPDKAPQEAVLPGDADV